VSVESVRRALIVEDDDTSRYFLKIVLQELGLEVTELSTGSGVIETVDTLDPDVVLLDIGLPGQSGTAILEALRTTSLRDDVPVIVITGNESEEVLSLCLGLGADGYLRKPVSARELRWRIQGIFRLNRYRRGMQKLEALNRAREERDGLASMIRALADAPGVHFVRVGADGLVEDCSSSFRERFLHVGDRLLDAVHPATLAGFESSLEQVQWGGLQTVSLSGNLVDLDGSPVEVTGTASRLEDPSGQVAVLVTLLEEDFAGLGGELYDRVGAAEEFLHLAAGAGHDLRNSLAILELTAGLLDIDPSPSEIGLAVDNMKAVAADGRHLANLLTSNVAPQEEAQGSVCIVNATKEAFSYVRTIVPRRIHMELLVEEELEESLPLPAVPVSFVDLRRCLLNLVVNARDAISSVGTITVCLERSAKMPDAISLSVRDTGQGIPEELIKRVFKPLFTTKPKGSGTGLGLAIVKALVAKAAGRIQVESSRGEGTTIHLHLPLESVHPEVRRHVEPQFH
jgi:two-component system cell cycle sensor histidine kinase/response regulator CckA